MIPQYKPLLLTTSLVAMSTLLSVNNSLKAEDIDWVRVDTNSSSMDITFSSASNGTFDSEDTVYLYHSAASGGFYDAPNGPETNIDFAEGSSTHLLAGESVSAKYTFSHLFTDGKLPIFNAWQYNDYKVEVFGGNAVITTDGVTQGNSTNNNTGVEGVDYEIIGEGSSSVTLNKLNTENSGSFYGNLEISGTWSGIKFTQIHDADTARTIKDETYTPFDSLTRTRITGIKDSEIVPEPSSSLLILCGSGMMLFRRKRD